MARLAEIVFDCDHPASLARFWAAALDGYEVRPYDDAEIERLASLGLTPETDPVVMVDGPGPKFGFQRIEGRSADKNVVHVDIEAADRSAEVARLVALGAVVREAFDDHTWMTDLEGNDFCVTDPR
jgi:hypothetical protein